MAMASMTAVFAFLLGATLLLLILALPYVRRIRRKMLEYQMLTQVGQAVTARLDQDEILRTVHRELGRICDTRSFYIALLDRDEIHFDFETLDGRVRPRRQRKLKRGITEHILNTRQPLLVRSGMEDRRRQLALEQTGEPSKSFCGVPIFIGGKAIGVMAAISREREHAYDERDVELMRTAAAQLAVALENARRFHQEQSRAEYLSFLNNISKAAISSKKPAELLAQVVEEVQHSFGFDHISIGIADYARKELEVRAEAGGEQYRLGIGKRVPLEAGVLGIAAQKNELRASGAEMGKLNGGSASNRANNDHAVLCHPITYGETLLGTLTVESFSRRDFSEEEILTLGTLADVLATALHNAMTFEEMEYQSITDCLTGIKTRRYFLESIQAEWSRASRSGRPFSLMLIDLDKFKQVNDGQGHLEGDLVLARVGHILEQKCRQSNVVARYGGDEFVVLLPETTIDQAESLGERLRNWLATDPLLSERHVTGSFGVASFPLHGATVEEIIRQADQAMYASKSSGGNRVSTPAMQVDAAEIQPERVAT
jgi:diguanylate cyclase (GGDEF)-like protein